MADEADQNEATTHADTYHRHGQPDPKQWDEADAVTDRPNDLQEGKVRNSTFADRAKPQKKVVDADAAENKAVQSAEAKAPAKARARKSSK